MKAARTKTEYNSTAKNPIRFSVGDELIVGETYDENPNWTNWVKCTSQKNQTEGWVPAQLIEIDGDRAIAIADYSAQELTVVEGVEVEVIKSLNGWSWCRTREGNEGWLPDEVLEDDDE